MKILETYLEQVTVKDTQAVIEALEHLANFKDVRAVTAIQNAFFHYEHEVRHAAAQATGFPPKVVPWALVGQLLIISRLATVALIGKPLAIDLAIAMMSGFTPKV